MQILQKKILSESAESRITQIEVSTFGIAQNAKAGQFVVLMVSAEGERIPLTIVDKDTAAGKITLVFQEVGLTTQLLGKKNAGDSLYSLAGPLGRATEIRNYGQVILVGGGVGIAEIYPVARALKEAGNRITAILGIRSKPLLILEKELKGIADEFFVTTDDGSYGRKGFVTDVLRELLTNDHGFSANGLIYAVGPIPMMRKVSELTKEFKIKTVVSLNPLMVDGTGMCGCCRVTVNGKTMFSCVDGPEFEAQSVDWEGLEKRNRVYSEKEKHICKLLGR
jgi:ferredoxin--NADP+ reductase